MKSHTIGSLLRSKVQEHPQRVALMLPGKSGFEDVTYTQLWDLIRGYVTVLRERGLKRGDRVSLISENCGEWTMLDWACQTLGLILVPVYPTLPADQAEYIIRDAGSALVVAGSPDQKKKLELIKDIPILLLKGEADALHELAGQAKPLIDHVAWNAEIDATKPTDVATIIYTSGTTGNPKGAMLTHLNFVHVCDQFHSYFQFDFHLRVVSFLPMSHIFERIVQAVVMSEAGTIAYAKSLMSLASDMQTVKPTLLGAVPRFLENLREKILDGVSKQSPTKQKLFKLALDQGLKRQMGQFAPLAGPLDKIVCAKVRERTGGEIRYIISGGAALARHVAEFYMGVGLTVLQGYGLTETTGGSFCNHPKRNKYWTVGESLGLDCKIAEDGEILLRGDGVMVGYYNLPEETAKALDPEGWFHTGDIGEFEGNALKITDRKKDLLVLGNGKNIAPQPLENKLKSSQYIQEAVLLGDGMDYVCALIVPQFDALRNMITSKGMTPPEDNSMLIALDEVKALIAKEIQAVNKTLANFEIVKKHVILPRAFTIESGELTPSLKVKRKVIREAYKAQIDSMR